jgi:hypothetical protein
VPHQAHPTRDRGARALRAVRGLCRCRKLSPRACAVAPSVAAGARSKEMKQRASRGRTHLYWLTMGQGYFQLGIGGNWRVRTVRPQALPTRRFLHVTGAGKRDSSRKKSFEQRQQLCRIDRFSYPAQAAVAVETVYRRGSIARDHDSFEVRPTHFAH